MTRQRLAGMTRGAAGLIALVGLVVGVPLALGAMAGWPLPTRLPDPASLGRLLTSRAELPATTVLKGVALVGWVAWLEVAAATVLELVAFAAKGHAVPLPLPWARPAQSLAARLVATAALLFVAIRLPSPSPAHLVTVPLAHTIPAAASAPATAMVSFATVTSSPAAEHEYVVEPNDWLSSIARAHLGSSRRWPEIFERNRHHRQPDGRALVDPNLIRPGWHLLLPPDATDMDDAGAAAPASGTAPTPPPSAQSSSPREDLATIDAAKTTANGTASPDPAPAAPTTASSPKPADDEATVTPASVATTPASSPKPTDEPAPVTPATTLLPPTPAPAPSAVSPTPASTAGGSPAAGGGQPLSLPTGSALLSPTSPESGTPPARRPPRPGSDHRTVALAIPAFIGGVALLRLGKLRANQQRLRRRGRDIPRPPAPLQQAEARTRIIADEDAPRWVDAVSRSLWRTLEQAELASIPKILAVRVGTSGVELLLDGPHPDAPEGYRPADADHVWRLAPDMDLADLETVAQGQSAALPALLAVGETPEGPILIDLEAAGTLAVEGDPERVEAFLAGAALELAAAPWTTDVPVLLVGGDPALAPLDDVELVQGKELSQRFPALVRISPDARTRLPLVERIQPGAGEHLAPTAVVVAPGAAPAELLSRLAARARPGSGVVLVAPGPLPETSWRLHIEASGAARLEPVGIEVNSRISADHVAELAALLHQATDQDDVALVVDLPPPVPVTDGALEPALWVRVLGPVEVDWPHKAPRPRSAEIVAYLATHNERPVSGERLRATLWPGDDEASQSTLISTVSRARAALGEDDQGLPHLPDAAGGYYQLRSGVGCDWQRFQALVARARHAPETEANDLLRAALALVRGAPFADPPKGAYGWALAELVSIMEVAIVEAAERLGELALGNGDTTLTAWAARQGLLVCPGREGLYQLLMRAADLAEDPDGVEAAWREVRRAVRAIDRLEEPRSDTIALYESLTARQRQTPTPDSDLRDAGNQGGQGATLEHGGGRCICGANPIVSTASGGDDEPSFSNADLRLNAGE